MGTRSGAERDAVTVEIAFAVVTGAFAAALVFGLVAGTAWSLDLSAAGLRIGGVAGCLAFVARVVQVLWRFTPGTPDGTAPRPGRAGRTHSDA
ncbi:DUF6332 family protein [Streptomyces sp. NPDC087851]|uniref:DUF6332 family protein n=1 Tax=Streptomyces sp. NPDC087851 TaxID=3365810 RepID=UPI003819C732